MNTSIGGLKINQGFKTVQAEAALGISAMMHALFNHPKFVAMVPKKALASLVWQICQTKGTGENDVHGFSLPPPSATVHERKVPGIHSQKLT